MLTNVYTPLVGFLNSAVAKRHKSRRSAAALHDGDRFLGDSCGHVALCRLLSRPIPAGNRLRTYDSNRTTWIFRAQFAYRQCE